MEELTVKELKKQLKNMPDDALVIIGDDEELNDMHDAYFVAEIINSQDRREYSEGRYYRFDNRKKYVLIS